MRLAREISLKLLASALEIPPIFVSVGITKRVAGPAPIRRRYPVLVRLERFR